MLPLNSNLFTFRNRFLHDFFPRVPIEGGKMSAKYEEDIFRRTSIISSIDECIRIVENIRGTKPVKPVAVDLEGIHLKKMISLVQIKTQEDRIYLFRTGLNPELFTKGGIKDLLEDHTVIKVMHGARSDCHALYKMGIKLTHVFDTCMAHKVIQYQNHGEPMINAKDISFNNVCAFYGVQTNPVKETMKDDVWKRANEIAEKDPLPRDLALYSACDVDPLYPVLYQIMSSAIEPEFHKYFEELAEIEMLRTIDPDLARLRIKARTDVELCDIFVKDLQPNITKFDLYEVLLSQPGMKAVDLAFKSRTAHVTVQDRKEADQICRLLKDKDHFQNSRLLVEMKPEEIQLTAEQQAAFMKKLEKEGFVLDNNQVASVVSYILEQKFPVVLTFTMREGNVLLEMYFGQKKSEKIRFHICKLSIEEGKLGDLFSSVDVIKIVDRIENETGLQATAKFFRNKEFRNFFDLTLAFKMFNYWQRGNALFAGSSAKVTDSLKEIGLEKEAPHDMRLLAFLELRELLPVPVLDIMNKKQHIELDILAKPQDPKPREFKKEMRGKYENKAIHVSLRHNCRRYIKLLDGLKEYLHGIKFPVNDLIALTPNEVVIELKSQNMAKKLLHTLRKEQNHQIINRNTCWINPVETPQQKHLKAKLPVCDVIRRKDQLQKTIGKGQTQWAAIWNQLKSKENSR